jgi:enoyl-[acyl-carrier protein] reductase I
LSDLSGAVTGEVHFVDCGYSTIAMPNLNALKQGEETEAPVEKAPREAAQ